MKIDFKNEAFLDFSEEPNRRLISSALSELDAKIARRELHAMPIVGGQELAGGEKTERLDPSDSAIVLGETRYATDEDAFTALKTVSNSWPSWRDAGSEAHREAVRKIGQAIRDQRGFFTALLIREAGKPWKEADADVAEAIDFCFYYAECMGRLSGAQLTEEVLGEDNRALYEPRGVVVIIAPWNFPLAILCGMTVAALVTGNGVILKPSEQTSLVGAALFDLILAAGVPTGAAAFLPGRGEVVGKILVESPLTDMIVFTGSKAVGLEIIKSASIVHAGQRSIKRVVAELGGKNAIIVDEDADMDDAVRGVMHSAFGYAGQKCSACSRLIVVGTAYEPLLKRLALATKDLLVGPAALPASVVGPVIDEESQFRILQIIQRGKSRLVHLVSKELSKLNGYFVPPTIFRDVPVEDELWREEVFGPVLAAMQVKSFDEALQVANDSSYALTGGVFSRHPAHIERAKREFRVGNLYINRGCTGALVMRQPFGGFRHSGIGSKAGGPDYLLQFLEPRTITENTMRRGFTPELG
jgi:RHH-type proline utilization regulon transcriptional repressor/proline dehydrogenase/delta 1-pyrroline-5-carboxylate dehydrogenase